MAEEDEDKTTFFAGKEVFCYQKIPFGLKNAGATYQRLVDKVFGDQIGRNLKSYVDDMVIKSTSEEDIDARVVDTSTRSSGIRANHSKVKAITDLEPPRTLKEIHSFNGKLASLSRFLSKGVEKSLPFFKALKSCTDKKTIQWTTNAEEAFRRMKELVEILPTLTAPIKGEVLVMYLTASVESISAVLLAKREERQVPIYFNTSYKFQGHPIRVLTDAPIKKTLTSPEKSGRIAKWAIELGKHDIEFGGRGSRKTQIPKDFSIEIPPKEGAGLMIADSMRNGNQKSSHFTDSQLMENQIKGIFKARQPTIKQYLEKVKEVLKGFGTFTIEHVKRNQNKKADALSKLALMTFEHLTKEVLVEVLAKRLINNKEVSEVEAKRGENWMTLIYEYLLSGLLLEDPKESRKIKIKAPQYKLIERGLYKRSYLTPWLRCIGP
ncbi:reverse transcriptase domain-containing protein [Tanacetum coccineum]